MCFGGGFYLVWQLRIAYLLEHKIFLNQLDVLDVEVTREEKTGRAGKLVRAFGCIETCRAAARQAGFKFRMPCEISRETSRHNVTLRQEAYACGQGLRNLRSQEGIMCTRQHDSVNVRVLTYQLIGIFPHKIICARLIELAILNKWHPKRASLLTDTDIRPKFAHLNKI